MPSSWEIFKTDAQKQIIITQTAPILAVSYIFEEHWIKFVKFAFNKFTYQGELEMLVNIY